MKYLILHILLSLCVNLSTKLCHIPAAFTAEKCQIVLVISDKLCYNLYVLQI